MFEKITQYNIHNIRDVQKKLFWVLSGMLILIAILYAYFVNVTISNVVERKNLQEKIAEKSTEISELEFAYMQLQNTITLEHARTIGFREVADPQYVTKGEAGPTLSLRGSR